MAKPKINKAQQMGMLTEKLQSLEDIDPFYLPPQLSELRNKIFFIHVRLETGLDSEITNYLREPYKKFKGIKKIRQSMGVRTYDLLEEMSYSRKINFVEKKKLLDKPLIKKLKELNKIRNYFAHPRAHGYEIGKFEEDDKYIETLKFLLDIYDDFNKIAGKRLAEFKKEDGSTDEE